MQKSDRSLSAESIARILNAAVVGDGTAVVHSGETPERATDAQLTFIGAAKHVSRLQKCRARVVIAPAELRDTLGDRPGLTLIFCDEPESAFLAVIEHLTPRRMPTTEGISDAAVIAPTAIIGKGTVVEPTAVIGSDVVIGDGCRVGAGAVIGDGCRIGHRSVIHPRVTLYADVTIGADVTIHAGCVIGADGFGYRTVGGRHERLPHFGTVRIEDDVEIGALSAIDRAKVGETVIGTGTRIDNLVMIGHNCRVGRHNLLVSQVGFAGSVTTDDYVVCAGQAGIADHVHLGAGAIVGAKAGVPSDLEGGRSYLGAPAAPATETARQLMALKKLPELRSTVRNLQKQIAALTEQIAEMESKGTPESDHEAGNRAA